MMWMILVTSAFAGVSEEAVLRSLSVKDAVSCASLGAPSPELQKVLMALAAPETLPPAVPVRAAQCLVEGYAGELEVQAVAKGWIKDASTAGLAMVALNSIDLFPEAVGLELARMSQEEAPETWRPRYKRKLMASKQPAIQAVANPGMLEPVAPSVVPVKGE